MYLTRGMTCAKALRQEVFPVRKKVMAVFCPAGYPTTSLFEYLLLVAPEIMGNSQDHDPTIMRLWESWVSAGGTV